MVIVGLQSTIVHVPAGLCLSTQVSALVHHWLGSSLLMMMTIMMMFCRSSARRMPPLLIDSI